MYFGVIVFLLCTTWHRTEAMKCILSEGNEISSQFFMSSPRECPRMLDDPNDMFCCLNEHGNYYCCDAEEFGNNLGAGIVIAIVVGAIILVCALLSICCCCCPCCCLYKRRHRGTVYGNMPQPGVQTTVVHMPQQMAPMHASPYPAAMQQASAVPPQPGFYPPTYNEATTKQAPYNPHY